MFLAPPLPEDGKRRGKLCRAMTWLGLVAALLSLAAANIVLSIAVYFAVDPRVSPRELYHRTWEAAKDNYYDPAALKNWDEWEHKYDSQIKSDEDAMRYAAEMLESLGDRYTFLIEPQKVQADRQRADGQFIGIGVTLRTEPDALGRPVVAAVIRGSPAHQAGITAGDTITAVDGRQTAGWPVETTVSMLRGDAGTAVGLAIQRGGTELTLSVARGPVNIPIVTVERLPDGIGYIRLEAFDQWDTADEMEEALRQLADCRAMVLDLRGNPGGFIHSAILVSAMFLDEGTITTEQMRLPGHGYLTTRYAVDRQGFVLEMSAGPFQRLPLPIPFRPENLAGDRPVVLLVDGGTASAAEIVTGALKDNKRVLVAGERTFGKGIGQTYIPVGNGARLRVTNIRGFTPNGSFIGDGGNTTAFGIEPDIVVPAQPGLIYGEANDNQLSFAQEHLKRVLDGK